MSVKEEEFKYLRVLFRTEEGVKHENDKQTVTTCCGEERAKHKSEAHNWPSNPWSQATG